MTKKLKIFLGVLIVILAGIALAAPFAWRASMLHWAKSSAWRSMNKLGTTDRRMLNDTPTMIVLPAAHLAAPLDGSELGNYIVRVPGPTHKTVDPKFLTFSYPQFDVRIHPHLIVQGHVHERSGMVHRAQVDGHPCLLIHPGPAGMLVHVDVDAGRAWVDGDGE